MKDIFVVTDDMIGEYDNLVVSIKDLRDAGSDIIGVIRREIEG